MGAQKEKQRELYTTQRKKHRLLSTINILCDGKVIPPTESSDQTLNKEIQK